MNGTAVIGYTNNTIVGYYMVDVPDISAVGNGVKVAVHKLIFNYKYTNNCTKLNYYELLMNDEIISDIEISGCDYLKMKSKNLYYEAHELVTDCNITKLFPIGSIISTGTLKITI